MKRKLSLFMAMALTLGSTNSVYATDFNDTTGHWAQDSISQWADYGVVGGYQDGTFKPSDEITRAEVSALIDKVMRYQEVASNSFADLNGTEWYATSILKNVEAGNMKGYTDGTVGADRNVTRQEVAAMLCSAFDIEPITGNTTFADDSSIPEWSKGSIKALQTLGYINGRSRNLFAPKEAITIAEVVAMLDNIVTDLYNTAGTYENISTGNVVINTPDVVLKDTKILGDLYVAAGVGNGDLTLDNVEVTGEVIVEGGGTNSVKFTNGSKANSVKIQKNSDNGVRLFVDEKSAVSHVDTAGKAGVKLEGKGNFGTVNINGTNNVEVAEGTKIDKATVNGGGTLTNNGTIIEITISENAINVTINGTGTVETVFANNSKVTLDLIVINVVIGNNNIKITISDKVKNVVDKNGNDVKDKVTIIGGDKNTNNNNNNNSNDNSNYGNAFTIDGTFKPSVTYLGRNDTKATIRIADANNTNAFNVYYLVNTTGSAINTTGSAVTTSSAAVTIGDVLNSGNHFTVGANTNYGLLEIPVVPGQEYEVSIVLRKGNSISELQTVLVDNNVDTTSPEFKYFEFVSVEPQSTTSSQYKVTYRYSLNEACNIYTAYLGPDFVNEVANLTPAELKDYVQNSEQISGQRMTNVLKGMSGSTTSRGNFYSNYDYKIYMVAEDMAGNLSEVHVEEFTTVTAPVVNTVPVVSNFKFTNVASSSAIATFDVNQAGTYTYKFSNAHETVTSKSAETLALSGNQIEMYYSDAYRGTKSTLVLTTYDENGNSREFYYEVVSPIAITSYSLTAIFDNLTAPVQGVDNGSGVITFNVPKGSNLNTLNFNYVSSDRLSLDVQENFRTYFRQLMQSINSNYSYNTSTDDTHMSFTPKIDMIFTNDVTVEIPENGLFFGSKAATLKFVVQ